LPLLPLLERFDAYEVEQLLSISNVLELPRGSWLFGAGSAANACFLVIRGAVEVIAKFQNLERRVALAAPGELVGYLAVLEGAPHGAAARVRESACLLEFPARQFLAQHERNSNLARAHQYATYAAHQPCAPHLLEPCSARAGEGAARAGRKCEEPVKNARPRGAPA